MQFKRTEDISNCKIHAVAIGGHARVISIVTFSNIFDFQQWNNVRHLGDLK